MKDVSTSFTNLLEKADDTNDEYLEFSLDGGSTNNVSRFINHSCDPNLFLQCMLEEHHDPRLARVFLVASEDIPPLQSIGTGWMQNNPTPFENECPNDHANRCSVQWHCLTIYGAKLGDVAIKHVTPG
ncbi:hypothetical protein POM88_047756 [Heracleum sosnowskyi]|uniref:SET domain-containing protein n=1 Tax=Heracleum sosnowskyi TaxID=360622 RepID=A0AAD8GSM6_9APIA|nr:hypothetical protein POM88_047756 [Heracleum sosnowskyi]